MKKILFIILVLPVVMSGMDLHLYKGVDTVYCGANIVPESTQTIGTITNRWMAYFDTIEAYKGRIDTLTADSIKATKIVVDTLQASIIRNTTIDTLTGETLNVDIADIDTLTVDTAKIYKADIDTLTADSIRSVKADVDTLTFGDGFYPMYYKNGYGIYTGYFTAGVSMTTYHACITQIENRDFSPVRILCAHNLPSKYTDKIYILFGYHDDTIMTVDTCNTTNYYLPVKYKQPVRLPRGITLLPDTFVVGDDTIVNIETGMMVVDTSGGDTFKIFLNGTFVAK